MRESRMMAAKGETRKGEVERMADFEGLDLENIAAEHLLKHLKKRAPTSASLLGRDYRVNYVNDRLASMLPFSEEEILSMRCYELTGKTQPCPGCLLEQVFRTGEKARSKRRETREDGTPLLIEIHAVPVVHCDKVKAVIEFLMDKTQILNCQDQLERDFLALIDLLTVVLDSKDSYTARHSQCVSRLSLILARRLGMPEDREFRLEVAGKLHDIGKIGVPWSVLNKPGKLTDEEFALIRTHPVLGAKMVSRFMSFRDIVPIIRSHHERYDGKGYPDGLKGEDIVWEARVIGVADAFHAMVSRRSYKAPVTWENIRAELELGRGSQFDPDVAQAMIALMDEGKLDWIKEGGSDV